MPAPAATDVTIRPLADLRPAPGITWQHIADVFTVLAARGDGEDASRVRRLMTSIGQDGLRQPLAVDADLCVADGTHRAVACHLLGITDVPTEPFDDTAEYPSWYGA